MLNLFKNFFLTDITSVILIIFGYLPKSTLIKAAISREITPGITQWLQSTSEESRKLGMVRV